MTKYREILRLKSLGLSQQSIADSCNVSKKTVNRVLKRAKELNISWPLDKSDTDAVLAEMFFPSTKQVRSNKRMPDLRCYRTRIFNLEAILIRQNYILMKIIFFAEFVFMVGMSFFMKGM